MGELFGDIFGAGEQETPGFSFRPDLRHRSRARAARSGNRRRLLTKASPSRFKRFLSTPELPSLHLDRRGRRADRRGGEKRHRHRRRDQRWFGLGPKRSRGVDHPRARRDDSIGGAHGRRPDDACRSAGFGRFDSHLHRRFEPQSSCRIADRARQEAWRKLPRRPAPWPKACAIRVRFIRLARAARRRYADRRADVSGALCAAKSRPTRCAILCSARSSRKLAKIDNRLGTV